MAAGRSCETYLAIMGRPVHPFRRFLMSPVRLHGNDEDAKQKLNRAENLRAIPRRDPDFARLYTRRGDAESVNRALEDTLYLNRAHSECRLRQTADLLGFALMVNSLTLARHRAREAVRTAA
jgi:hypothetical protein